MTIAPLNPLMAQIAAPPIPLIQRAARAYDGAKGPLIDLSQAVPGYPAHPDMLRWLAEAAGSTAMLGYGPIEGEAVLRDAYAEELSRVYGVPVERGEIHVTAGANQAFAAAALAVAGPGEAVMLISPFYFNHDTTLALFGVHTTSCAAMPAAGFLPDPVAVDEAITPEVKALCLVTPNNPTGAIYPPELLGKLFDICVARNIWLIVDETYRDFLPVGAGAPHGILARPDWRDHFIGLYSFSKSFCIPGHRLGAVTAGEDVIATFAKIMDNLQICAPRAPQAALARALPALGEWREANRAEMAARAAAFRDAFDLLSGWQITAQGAYFAYVRHPFDQKAAQDVAAHLAARYGVITLPGSYFGAGQERFLRLAFANAQIQEFRQLAERLADAAELQTI